MTPLIDDSAERYTMSVGEVAQTLGCTRQTVHDYANSGVLSYRTKLRGKQPWKFFDPAEVQTYASKRAGSQIEK